MATALQPWEPKERRKKVAKDLAKIGTQITGATDRVAAALAPTAVGVVDPGGFGSNLRGRVDASKQEAIAGGVPQPDFMRNVNLPAVPAFSPAAANGETSPYGAGLSVPDTIAGIKVPADAPIQDLPAPAGNAVNVPTGNYSFSDQPIGPDGTMGVQLPNGAYQHGGPAITSGMPEISSERRGADLSAISPGNIRDLSPQNRHQNAPNHGLPGFDAAGNRVGDARPVIGGAEDTAAHLARVNAASQQMGGIFPSGAISVPGASERATLVGSSATPAAQAVDTSPVATAFSPTANTPGGRVPLINAGPSQAVDRRTPTVSEDMLQNINLSLGEGGYSKTTRGRGAAGAIDIPEIPKEGATHEDFLARGYGLAGDADGWASAIARTNQAHGYANRESASRNKNRKMSVEDRKVAAMEQKVVDDQKRYEEGALGRQADIELKQSQASGARQRQTALAKFNDADWRQLIFGKNSKGAITQKNIDDRAAAITKDIQAGLIPGYEGQDPVKLHGLIVQQLTDLNAQREKGKKLKHTPSTEKTSGFLGFGGTEAQPSSISY